MSDSITLSKIAFLQICEAALEEGRDRVYNGHHSTLLHVTAGKEQNEACEALLEAGFDPNASDGYGTPLHSAARAGSPSTCTLLIEHGASVHTIGMNNGPPLRMCDDLETYKVLLEAGSDPNCTSSNYTPLQSAIIGGRGDQAGAGEKVRLLIEHGVDVKAHPMNYDPFGENPLHLVAEFNAIEACQPLIDAGVDIEGKGREGKTPLAFAAYRGCFEICRILVANGARTAGIKNNVLRRGYSHELQAILQSESGF